ncbi:Transmembrane protein 53 [Operophtera brumata]|uniref:Transmembrane protein 53 n=1 Tax=Operophtera brumata TaxID=104452 RepID=A0A0L7LIG4_OPEBR|nr:Transmembrane protein 53 [Operophtera brumata]
MGVFRTAMALANQGKTGLRSNGKYSFRPLLSCAPVAMVGFERGAHSQDITKNIQYISNDKVKLNENEHPLVVHGFSVAGYIWGELCVHAMNDKELEITIGVPAAIFPKNAIMKKTLRAYME